MECHPRLETIAEKCGYSTKRIQIGIKRLEEAGLLTAIKRKGTSTIYKFHKIDDFENPFKRYIHRLVAEAFIPNPNNFPEINHINEDPSNNSVENLEWCTKDYNLKYGTRVTRMKEKLSTPILQYDMDDNFIAEYESQSDAAHAIDGNQSCIANCLRGRYKHHKNFKWRHKNEDSN